MKSLLIGIVILAALGVAGWKILECTPLLRAEPALAAQNPASSFAPRTTIEGIGFVEPSSEIRRLSFKAGGVIETSMVKIGDQVEKGAALMSLVNQEEKVAVQVAEAEVMVARSAEAQVNVGVNAHRIDVARRQVEAARAKVQYLTRESARLQDLVADETISASRNDRIQSELHEEAARLLAAEAEVSHLENYVLDEDRQLARQKVLLAEARVELFRTKLENTYLRAPLDGTVLEILRREGESVDELTRTPVLLLADLSRLRVRVEIDERSVQTLKVGQRAVVHGKNLADQSYEGKVTLVKQVMGKKTVFTRAASERKDLDVVEVFVEMEEGFRAPVGLRIDCTIHVGE